MAAHIYIMYVVPYTRQQFYHRAKGVKIEGRLIFVSISADNTCRSLTKPVLMAIAKCGSFPIRRYPIVRRSFFGSNYLRQ